MEPDATKCFGCTARVTLTEQGPVAEGVEGGPDELRFEPAYHPRPWNYSRWRAFTWWLFDWLALAYVAWQAVKETLTGRRL